MCLHLIFNSRCCYPSGKGFGVRHCHAQPSPDTWWAQSRTGRGGGGSQSPGGPCSDFASPGASCRDACKLQGLEPGRAIPRESPGHLQTVSAANIGNSGETRPSLTSSGGLAPVTSKSSHFSRSLCQAAAPIFELTFPGLIHLACDHLHQFPASTAQGEAGDAACRTRHPPPLPKHPLGNVYL